MAKGEIVASYSEFSVKLFFEDGHVDCDHCPLEETYSRKTCRRTGEILIDGKTVGHFCPLVDTNGEILGKGYLDCQQQ